MGLRMTCATTPKTGVAQGSANTIKKGLRHPPPLKGHPLKGAGWGVAHVDPSAEGVAQILREFSAERARS